MDQERELLNEDINQQIEEVKSSFAERIESDKDNVEAGLAKLVLTLIELLRRLMEKQAMLRIENNSLTDTQIEELGLTFMKLEEKMEELKVVFGLEDEELNIDLGPLGKLI